MYVESTICSVIKMQLFNLFIIHLKFIPWGNLSLLPALPAVAASIGSFLETLDLRPHLHVQVIHVYTKG